MQLCHKQLLSFISTFNGKNGIICTCREPTTGQHPSYPTVMFPDRYRLIFTFFYSSASICQIIQLFHRSKCLLVPDFPCNRHNLISINIPKLENTIRHAKSQTIGTVMIILSSIIDLILLFCLFTTRFGLFRTQPRKLIMNTL